MRCSSSSASRCGTRGVGGEQGAHARRHEPGDEARARAVRRGADDRRLEELAVARRDPAGLEAISSAPWIVSARPGARTVSPSTRVAPCASGARWKRRSKRCSRPPSSWSSTIQSASSTNAIRRRCTASYAGLIASPASTSSPRRVSRPRKPLRPPARAGGRGCRASGRARRRRRCCARPCRGTSGAGSAAPRSSCRGRGRRPAARPPPCASKLSRS